MLSGNFIKPSHTVAHFELHTRCVMFYINVVSIGRGCG